MAGFSGECGRVLPVELRILIGDVAELFGHGSLRLDAFYDESTIILQHPFLNFDGDGKSTPHITKQCI